MASCVKTTCPGGQSPEESQKDETGDSDGAVGLWQFFKKYCCNLALITKNSFTEKRERDNGSQTTGLGWCSDS